MRKRSFKWKLQTIFYIVSIFIVIGLIRWVEPKSFLVEIKKQVNQFVCNQVIVVVRESHLKASYMFSKNETLLAKMAENINETNHIYSFVQSSYSNQNLIVYDPNIAVAGANMDNEQTDTATDSTEKESVKVSETKALEKEEKPSNTSQTAVVFSPAFRVEQLKNFDFLLSNLYIVPARAKVLESDLDAEQLLAMNMAIQKDASVPQILIYHTHGSETFVDSTDDLLGTGIMAVGAKLAQILSTQYGYNVMHCTELFDNVNGVFDRSQAYTYSREAVVQILKDHPSIQVIIDLHRDGVREDLHLVTDINGKQTAQIMFFNGVSRSTANGEIDYLYNKYRSENLSFSLQAKLEAMGKYPNFTRKNYIDAYQYNLDLVERALLVEAGAQTNTLQEELNAMEPLADILDSVLSGQSRKNMGLEMN